MAVMIKAHAEREAHLKAAQVAHLEACAYRGVAYDPGEGEGCLAPASKVPIGVWAISLAAFRLIAA